MDLVILQHIAFIIFFLAVVAYAALDGFDLGVGCLHLFARNDLERRIFLNAIGPVWDGNSVWIVISMGVLFAGFPKAFVALTSGMYLPMMFLVFFFMFRAAALEFRSKYDMWWWRNMWDILFFLSSLCLSIDLGMVIGNVISGLPLNEKGIVAPQLFRFFNAYSVVVGIMNLHLFMMHGAIYLILKTEGELRLRLMELSRVVIYGFLFFWTMATILTFLLEKHMFQRFETYPALILLALAAIGAVSSIPRYERKGLYMRAFLASGLSIALLIALTGIGLYPNILTSSIQPEKFSLTLYNSSSSATTLRVIAMVVAVGVPLSGFYLSYLYKVFKGKVVIDSTSY